MRQFLKLVVLVLVVSVPFPVSASEQDLMRKSYLKLENILHFMEYSNAVENECATVNNGQAYKNWLMFNISKLKVMTTIQRGYQVKATAMGDSVAKDYFKNESEKRQKMVNKAVSMIADGSSGVKTSLCKRLQDMVIASKDRSKVDSDLQYLVRNKSKILNAIADDSNW